MVNCLGNLGSKLIFFPFSFRFFCVPSAEVMAEVVARTYSLAAVRAGSGAGTSVGQRAVWMVVDLWRTSCQM